MPNEEKSGVPINDLCRKFKIDNSTYYKLKYAGMSLSELTRLKALKTENQRLKLMYAELSLDHKILKGWLNLVHSFHVRYTA
jgi:putative transposase